MRNKLSIEVFVGAPSALYVTSTIIFGQRDAVLIDAQFTRADARRLADRIRALERNLTTVYVTHGHPDHYWGFSTLAEDFPGARFVTAPEVAGVIEATQAAKVALWKPLLGDEVPDDPLRPRVLDGDAIDLEGTEIKILHLGQGDVGASTVVWIPPLSTLVSGDLAYSGTHLWLAETGPAERREWIANLERLAEMTQRRVIAGHQAPGARSDWRHVLLAETRDYIAAFDAAIAGSANAQELMQAMVERYPHRALPVMLEIAANAAFPSAPRGAAPNAGPVQAAAI
jgi:glyoxylase-like metal-dependent hydrolase (beta-lactamase superfamily II)